MANRKYDDNPPSDPVKRIVHVVDVRGRPDEQSYRVLPRTVYPRKRRGPLDKGKGGWKGSPNSLAALDLHRERGYVQHIRHCAREGCRQPAVKGVDFCRHHGGRNELNVRRRLDPNYRPRRSTLFRRELRNALRDGNLPMDLLRQPVFIAVLNGMLDRLPDRHDPDYWTEKVRQRACTRLALELMHAWVALTEANDHAPWARAAAKAKSLGIV